MASSLDDLQVRDSQPDHDFLSFLSVFVGTFDSITTDLTLATVLLDDLVYGIPENAGEGGSFSITIVERMTVYQRRRVIYAGSGARDLPPYVALKTPIFQNDVEIDNMRGRRLLNSMAMEVQILKNETLRSHENIVSLFGVCWQSFSPRAGLVMPVLVLESADCGDLKRFMKRRGGVLCLQDQLRLSAQIATGLDAIHKLGIIHCDIKPENILIFTTGSDSVTAKIADFGSALLLSDIGEEVNIQVGTRIWQAPECPGVVRRDNLVKTDVFSLGLLLWYIFAAPNSEGLVDGLMQSDDLHILKVSDELRASAFHFMEEKAQAASSSTDAEILRTVRIYLAMALAGNSDARADSVDFISVGFLNLFRELSPNDMAFAGHEAVPADPDSIATVSSPELPQVARSGSTIEVSINTGTVRMLPAVVVEQLLEQMRIVANSPTEDSSRRKTSAFQFFVLKAGLMKFPGASSSDIAACLEYLEKAAHLGHEFARYIVIHMHNLFGRPCHVSPEDQLPWLTEGTVRGSPIARKMLQNVNRPQYTFALDCLRSSYTGFGSDAFPQGGSMGRINDTVAFGDTALLCACRAGHTQAVKKLLFAGADPRIAAPSGVTTLHLLSSFPESETCEMGKLLHSNGADLEARTTDGGLELGGLDRFYSYCMEGTPLLWAVAAVNLPACQVLVKLGADPFDVKGADIPPRETWGKTIYMSPVHLAAQMHQFTILEALLPKAGSGPSSSATTSLNNCYRQVAGVEESKILPLLCAVDYYSEGVLRRLLHHGNDHEFSCLKTLQLLLEYGANPRNIGFGVTALQHAVLGGQPFLVEFLLSWHGGALKPFGRELRSVVFQVVSQSDRQTFHILTREGLISADHHDTWTSLLPDLAEKTNDVYFISPVIEAIRSANAETPNFSIAFQQAIVAGNLDVAEYLFSTGNCDLATPRNPSNSNEVNFNVVGRLIVSSKKYRNLHQRLDRVLALYAPRTEILRSDALVDDDWRFKPLHVAVITPEYRRDLNTCGDIIDVLLNYFDAPEYLNAKSWVSPRFAYYAGYTPLHWAVEAGNTVAVHKLLGEDNVDATILNARGENAYDICLKRLEKLSPGPHETQNLLPLEREYVEISYLERTRDIIEQLQEKNLLPHKYTLSVFRKTENDLVLTPFGNTMPYLLTGCDLSRIPSDADQVMLRVKNLAVGQAYSWAVHPRDSAAEAARPLILAIATASAGCGLEVQPCGPHSQADGREEG